MDADLSHHVSFVLLAKGIHRMGIAKSYLPFAAKIYSRIHKIATRTQLRCCVGHTIPWQRRCLRMEFPTQIGFTRRKLFVTGVTATELLRFDWIVSSVQKGSIGVAHIEVCVKGLCLPNGNVGARQTIELHNR